MDQSKTKSALVFNAAVIVCSDRASQGEYEDKSGEVCCEWLKTKGYALTKRSLVPDSANALQETIDLQLSNDLIVISGGTGLGPRDITPQTLDAYCDYLIPGFGEILRLESRKYSHNAYLSRCGAWMKNRTLILALPGNPKAVTEQLGIIEELLTSALTSVKGLCTHRRKVNDA